MVKFIRNVFVIGIICAIGIAAWYFSTSEKKEALTTKVKQNLSALNDLIPLEFDPAYGDGNPIYDVLVAEIALRRGYVDIAVDKYVQVAKSTLNEEAAEQAVRLAIYAKNVDLGIEAAKIWIESAVKNNSDIKEPRIALASLYIRSNELQSATDEFEILLTTVKNPSVESELTAQERQSIINDLLDRFAQLMLAAEDHKLAAQNLKTLISKYGENPGGDLLLATFLYQINSYEEAREILEQLYQEEPDERDVAILLAKVHHSSGRISAGLSILEEYTSSHADDSDAKLAYARMLVSAKQYSLARTEFENLLKTHSDNGDLRYALSLLLIQTNQIKEAHGHLLWLVEHDYNASNANFYLGRIAEEEERVDDAMTHYSKVIDGEYAMQAHTRIAVLVAGEGEIERAREYLHVLHEDRNSDPIQLYQVEGEILIQHERLEDAMVVYNEALKRYTNNSELLYSRAMLAVKLERIDQVEADLRQIIADNPNHIDAMNALGYTLADHTDRYDEALELIEKAYKQNPENYYIVDSMGWVHYRLGNYDKAIDYLRKALELKPDAEISAHLGEVLWVTGEKVEAKEVWDAALKLRPDDEVILDLLKRFGL